MSGDTSDVMVDAEHITVRNIGGDVTVPRGKRTDEWSD